MATKRGFWDGLIVGFVIAALIGLAIASEFALRRQAQIPDWVVVQNTLPEPVTLTCWRANPEDIMWEAHIPVMGTVRLEFANGNIHASPDFPKNIGLTMVGQLTGKTVEARELVPETVMAERPYRVILLENQILLTTAEGGTRKARAAP